MTLAEFVLARITEDEEQASLAGNAMDRGQFLPATGDLAGLAATFDPARVLAECEAKRQIVGTVTRGMDDRGVDGMEAPAIARWNGEKILGLLAQPYADHPDFREEWRL